MNKILVLDVDETLLNLERLSFLERFKKNYKEYEGSVIFDNYYISPRPNVVTFLNKVNEKFVLVAFSVADREMTIQKLQRLNIFKFFSKVYGRDSLINGKKSFL